MNLRVEHSLTRMDQDVGCGSGYLTAIFSNLVGSNGSVVGIEHIKPLSDLAEANLIKDGFKTRLDNGQIKVITGDGRLGYPPSAPYDAIHGALHAARFVWS